MKILYVENHPRFAAIALKSFLATHTVTLVPSVAAARDAVTRERFDLILLDYDLDDGKGTDLVEELRDRPNRPLLIGASSHAAGNEALQRAGVDGVCSKMQFANIAAAIDELVRKRHAA